MLRLLEFGREREGIDLSNVVLTHHKLKPQGNQSMPLGEGGNPKLEPLTEVGGASVQEKQKALLREIVEKLDGIFGGDTTDDDHVTFVDCVTVKLGESATLIQQSRAI